jgi:hypothetical protein
MNKMRRISILFFFISLSLTGMAQQRSLLKFGEFSSGDTVSTEDIAHLKQVHLVDEDGNIHSEHHITGGIMILFGITGRAMVHEDGKLGDLALSRLKNCSNTKIIFIIDYTDTKGTKWKTNLELTVR